MIKKNNIIKRFATFVNEEQKDLSSKSNTFKIKVSYEVGQIDIDSKGLILLALQKMYMGWDNIAQINDKFSFNYTIKNSEVKLTQIESSYKNEVFEVRYNEDHEEYVEFDKEEDVFNFVKELIMNIKYYAYRSIHSMDKKQKADIKILSVTKV